MSFKKNPTTEELKAEVELLQQQLVDCNNRLNSAKKQLKDHPLKKENEEMKGYIEHVEGKWWFRFFKWMGL